MGKVEVQIHSYLIGYYQINNFDKLFFYISEQRSNKSVLVLTKHGGHLGYFEGGIILPASVTWLERLVIEYVDSLPHVLTEKNINIPVLCDSSLSH